MKKISYKVLCTLTIFLLPINAIDEVNHYKLHNFIYSIADQLYCQAEVNGEGDNGENYKKIINQNIEQFKILLKEERIFINYQNDQIVTPLMLASYNHIWEFIELLIENGADISLRSLSPEHVKGLTALQYIKLGVSWRMPDIIMLIMQDYYTKERQNKCVDLLTTNTMQRIYYKRWI